MNLNLTGGEDVKQGDCYETILLFPAYLYKTGLGLICAILLAGVLAVWAAGQPLERIVSTTFRQAYTLIYLFYTPDRAPRRLTHNKREDGTSTWVGMPRQST